MNCEEGERALIMLQRKFVVEWVDEKKVILQQPLTINTHTTSSLQRSRSKTLQIEVEGGFGGAAFEFQYYICCTWLYFRIEFHIFVLELLYCTFSNEKIVLDGKMGGLQRLEAGDGLFGIRTARMNRLFQQILKLNLDRNRSI